MVIHVIRTAQRLGVERIIVVIGHGRDQVKPALVGLDVGLAVQHDQLGTGHAVLMARDELLTHRGEVLILSGDVPLVRADTLAEFVRDHRSETRAASVVTAELEEPGSLGRVVRDASGHFHRIVEVVDAAPEELALHEINSGMYCFAAAELWRTLDLLDTDNAQNQYYLTDTLRILREEGKLVGAWTAPDGTEVLGVNNPQELAEAERAFAARGGGS
jgi:bifunctional N-acetylglucosamine-1-phosphate-uridyltransferase/glucosamine-1-phosphate-acetyltransferase GlmU-like protein